MTVTILIAFLIAGLIGAVAAILKWVIDLQRRIEALEQWRDEAEFHALQTAKAALEVK